MYEEQYKKQMKDYEDVKERRDKFVYETIGVHLLNIKKEELYFMLDAFELCLKSRLAVAHAYGFRYFLKGIQKQQLFDFLIKDLSKEVDKLTKKLIEDILPYFDKDGNGEYTIIRYQFYSYKDEVEKLADIVNQNFWDTISQIETEMPEIVIDKKLANVNLKVRFDTWTCYMCTVQNSIRLNVCEVCRAARPRVS